MTAWCAAVWCLPDLNMDLNPNLGLGLGLNSEALVWPGRRRTSARFELLVAQLVDRVLVELAELETFLKWLLVHMFLAQVA